VNRIARYSSLAKQLSPAELAQLAARRAYRAARKALYREYTGANENRLLTGFGVTNRAELAEKALAWRSGRSWAELAQRPRVQAALGSNPAAQARAIARAEMACARKFDVFGRVLDFGAGRPIDWSVDAATGFQYPKVPSKRLSLSAGWSDPKFPWVVGRLDSLIALGQGYWAHPAPAERDKYARELVSVLDLFIDDNPVGVGIHWTCPMEVALRAANIAQALLMFADAPVVNAPDFVCRALLSLTEHTHFVEAHLEDEGAVPNNHLIANYVGLLVVGLLFPELPRAASHVALAVNGLREQVLAQVHPDGYSFEGSVPYHRLSVELFTLAYVTASLNGVDLGNELEARLSRMYSVAEAYCSSSGLAPQLGDNDSGRVLAFQDRESLDHGYLHALGASLFGSAELKRTGDVFPDEALWLLGSVGQARFESLSARAPFRSFSSPLGGLHVLRSDDMSAVVSAGGNGQRGVGGHSHNDKLSFELHIRGTPVIVDPGSPTYTREATVRNQFRSTGFHNTPQVEGREQAELSATSLFALPDTAACQVEEFVSGEVRDRLVAHHEAFPGIVVRRSFTLDKSTRALVVSDSILGNGPREVISRMHLPNQEARLRPLSEDEQSRAASLAFHVNFNTQAIELGPADAPLAVILCDQGLSVSLEDAHYSPGYGQLRESTRIVFRREGELPASWTWVVLAI
jgi:hypothetical protein